MRRLFAAALCCALAGDAAAFVRSRTSGTPGTPIHWNGSCVFIVPDSAATPDLPAPQVFSIIEKSAANWQNNDANCSYLQLNIEAPMPVEAHYDGVNVIKFRTDKWCHPDDSQSHGMCYDAMAAAITTVFFVDKPGDPHNADILDADIELNDLNFTFVVSMVGGVPPARPGTSPADLENTLTHELGHVQGLDHTCKDAATPANEVDDTGNPPPACNAIPPDQASKITSATMYNQASPGEIRKRMPKADDLAGICAIYPLAANPNMCAHTNLQSFNSRGCSAAAGARDTTAVVLLAFALLAGLAVVRHRRAR